jgi:hypothetical protein
VIEYFYFLVDLYIIYSLLALELEAFTRTMQQLLQDTQERLVYRTNIYIQTNIIKYSPAPGDLAYPEKLEMMEVSIPIDASRLYELLSIFRVLLRI